MTGPEWSSCPRRVGRRNHRRKEALRENKKKGPALGKATSRELEQVGDPRSLRPLCCTVTSGGRKPRNGTMRKSQHHLKVSFLTAMHRACASWKSLLLGRGGYFRRTEAGRETVRVNHSPERGKSLRMADDNWTKIMQRWLQGG